MYQLKKTNSIRLQEKYKKFKKRKTFEDFISFISASHRSNGEDLKVAAVLRTRVCERTAGNLDYVDTNH